MRSRSPVLLSRASSMRQAPSKLTDSTSASSVADAPAVAGASRSTSCSGRTYSAARWPTTSAACPARPASRPRPATSRVISVSPTSTTVPARRLFSPTKAATKPVSGRW